MYDLMAISNHSGSMSFGHYTAFCRLPDTGKWYEFDDGRVRAVNDEREL